MVGMLLRNEAQITVSDMALTQERADFVDFTTPISVER